MWNKLVEVLHNVSYRRLGIAVCISAILHALLFGGFDFRLPNLKKDMHLIEARIQMPKAVIKQIETKTNEDETLPKPSHNDLPKLADVPILEEQIQDNPSDETITNPEPIKQSQVAETSQQIEQTEIMEPDLQKTEQPVDIGLVINENAYRYVETDFDVRTETEGGIKGRASIIYNLKDDYHYELRWLTKGSGLTALLFPDLLQISEGLLTKSGLQPLKYLYQFGDKTDKTRTIDFNWQTKSVVMQSSKGLKTEDLTEGTQDLLSFMYQFMYVAPLQNLQIPIATGKKLAIYDYSFEGEENLNSPLGELKAIHIVHSGADSDDKTELWLAIDYQYLPIKIRKIEKDGNVVELEATRINTNRPTANR